ncbi:hypothetical protein F5Y12DRAFT_780281 [Xylaria sp. FL1777]|nr:hypothetical protein F5Y12DRAFT_780281 [Xylaria sp. FL1777]
MVTMGCIHTGVGCGGMRRRSGRGLEVAGRDVGAWIVALGARAWVLRVIRGSDDMAPFVVNAKALHCLGGKGSADPPSITAKEIWDRNTQDRYFKVAALVQSLYVVTKVVGRACQRLAISCLELITVTCYFWLRKALDVETDAQIYYLKIPRLLCYSRPATTPRSPSITP